MSCAVLQRTALAGLLALLSASCPCVPAAAATGTASQDRIPAGWREFEIPAGRFKVLLPNLPKTTRRTIRTDIGDVASTRYTTTDAADVTYDVLLNDYPKDGVFKVNPQKLLDGARDSLMFQTKGRMLSHKSVTVANFPGRDLEIINDDGIHYRARLVWVETRLYQIMTVTPGKPQPGASIFFDSFQITGKP
jgi:hypothetical protein